MNQLLQAYGINFVDILPSEVNHFIFFPDKLIHSIAVNQFEIRDGEISMFIVEFRGERSCAYASQHICIYIFMLLFWRDMAEYPTQYKKI